MEGSDEVNPCAICLDRIGGGGVGQAIFTAECSHAFHFNCIAASVAHGHLVCPLCNAQWRDLPFLRPPPSPPRFACPVLPPDWMTRGVHSLVFDDDEEVEAQPSSGQADDGHRPASDGAVVVKTRGECSAIARHSSSDDFAVLVHVVAPGMVYGEAARAPLDLVTVLDVSSSMRGHKLALLKQAMAFVIDNLSQRDRLCVVSFSTMSRRVTRLALMSDAGKDLSKNSVESLTARGGTNIAEGLRTAAKVLDERRHRNSVSSVILLSDGQDNFTNYEQLVPPSFVTGAPIHAFGFGSDHDANAMHVVAETTGGTFSFIENEAVIQDAFAQCIGGLLSVVVQDARIHVARVHPGVRINSVKSGRYESRVDEDGRAASVRVGELYADEERRFLLILAVPTAEATEDGDSAATTTTTTTTTLVKVVCSYRDAVAGGDLVFVTAEDTVLMRPEVMVGLNAEQSMEVERERVRVSASEDIAAARAAAERGDHQEAVEILERRRSAVARSDAARDGDPMTVALGVELQEMRQRVADRQSYARSGRAYMLAGMSSHEQQRASSRQMSSLLGEAAANVVQEEMPDDASLSYTTPAMRSMLMRSQRSRAGEDSETLEPEVPRT